jgi:hypothetical protein
MVTSIKGIPPYHAAKDGDGKEDKENSSEDREETGQGNQGQ